MKMPNVRRALLSALAIGVVAAVSGAGTFAAFSSSTGNSGNRFEAGTVSISDNDAGGTMLTLSNARPGDSTTGCIAVTYGGTLAADVRLYGNVNGALAPYLTLTVTRGTDPSPSFPGCAGFTADGANYIGAGAGIVYQGNLSSYPATWGGGIVDAPGSAETWTGGEQHVYRFRVTLQNNSAAEGLSASSSFTWEARNQ
jgi:predicted ribosomally synthesized peptide with SipW-like signal peptide